MDERADCIFCRIADGKIKSNVLYQDEELLAFPDINPLAPVHILIVPRKHIASVAEMKAKDACLIGDMAKLAKQLAVENGVAEKGFRLVINSGPDGGQGVNHLHMHLLGGRQLGSKLG
jgi:histidine triad (HIT) family protein